MTQTKFKDGKSPWANTAWERKGIDMKPATEKKTTPRPERKRADDKVIDVNTLKVTNDPIQVRRSTSSKYDAVFRKLPYGHCIVCEPDEAGRIGATLVKWLRAKGKQGSVKSVSHYEKDGKGRVWLLED